MATGVYKELNAVEVTGFIGGREGSRLGNFVRVAHAAERNVLGEALFQLSQRVALLPLFKQRCIHVAGAEGVNANAPLAQFARQGSGEGTNRSFGCAVDGDAREPFHGRDGAVQNNGCAVIQQGQSLLHGKEEPLHIGIEVKIKKLFVDGFHLAIF